MGKKLDTVLSKKIGLIAGDGELPVKLVTFAHKCGFQVIAIALSHSNKRHLSQYCERVYSFGPGEIEKIINTLHTESINQLSFIGKVHKGLLFRNPRLDSSALKMLKEMKKLNDDAIMEAVVAQLAKENIKVLDQTLFLRELFQPQGLIGNIEPTEEQKLDIEYGFSLAKEMGKLDIGQSVVVQNKMVLAVEAIEGTDKAIERGCRLGRNNAVVVKVSKPNQDKRFDVPTVGLNTLKSMKKYGGKVLAIEANETFIVEKEQMIEFANKNNMVFISV